MHSGEKYSHNIDENLLSKPFVSVIIVTCNPRWDLLEWALDSLENQTLLKDFFELIVVDNNSNPPLSEAHLQKNRLLDMRLIKESRSGITYARCAGIEEAKSDLLVFVDDDNHLDPDYLELAIDIAKQKDLGAFSGVARAVFETPVRPWQEKLLHHLGVRDNGAYPITSYEPRWGKWDPIGAGMVLRRVIGMSFVEFLEKDPFANILGRRGNLLMSGEDTLIARIANQMGYACSYQPALKLSHFMKKQRMTFKVLARTVEGHGRAYVLLRQILGNPVKRPNLFVTSGSLLARLLYRVVVMGPIAGIIEWFRDWGYFMQARKIYEGVDGREKY